jgi:hypothetical protein
MKFIILLSMALAGIAIAAPAELEKRKWLLIHRK